MPYHSNAAMAITRLTTILAWAFGMYAVKAGGNLTSCPKYPTAWFTQKLDHADSQSTVTFQQRYQLDTTSFKPGGPILFYQGAESSSFLCIEAHLFDDLATELGAITCSIEHRFFGQSFPAGVSADNATTKDFAPLTMENVVADSVDLVKWIKRTVPGANDSRVIVNSGSYGGSVATVDRLMYPDVFYASWPSAPLLRSFGPNLDANEDRYNWWDWIANVYQDASAEAMSKISKGLYQLVECTTTPANCKNLSEQLRFCDAGPSNTTEWTALYTAILDGFWRAAQFSYNIPSVWPVGHMLDYLISQTLLANDTGSVLRIPPMLQNWDTDLSHCLDWRSPNLTSAAAGTGIQIRPWMYINCAYFPGSTFSIRNGSMFPPQLQTGRVELCTEKDWQSPLYNLTNQEIIAHYNFTANKIEEVGRFFFTQDGLDPTTAVGPPPLDSSALLNASRAFVMPRLAHTEEIFSNAYEPQGLSVWEDEFRSIITEHIKGWVNEP